MSHQLARQAPHVFIQMTGTLNVSLEQVPLPRPPRNQPLHQPLRLLLQPHLPQHQLGLSKHLERGSR